MNGVQRSSVNAALLETLGPNPKAMFADLRNRAAIAARNAGDFEAERMISEGRRRAIAPSLDQVFAEVSGEANQVENLRLASIGRGLRAVESMAKLGGVLLSSIADIPIAVSELRSQGMGFFGAWGQYLNQLTKGKGKFSRQREIADLLGVGIEGSLGNVMSRFNAQDTVPGASSRFVQKFFNLTGLSWWTDANKTATGLILSRNLARFSGGGLDAMPAELRRALGSFKIGADDWEVLRLAKRKADDGREYILPGELHSLDLDQVAGLKGLPDGVAAERYLTELQTRFGSYIADRTDYAVLTPGAAERAMLRRGMRAGSVEGEAFRMFAQFKMFPIAVMRKVLGRHIHGAGKFGAHERMMLLEFAAMSTLFGYTAMSLKDVSRNKSPRQFNDDPGNNIAILLAAMAQGGGAGILGDFLFGSMTKQRFGQGMIGTIAGPVPGLFADVGGLFAKIKDGDLSAYDVYQKGMAHTHF